jgi:hypothetical protein
MSHAEWTKDSSLDESVQRLAGDRLHHQRENRWSGIRIRASRTRLSRHRRRQNRAAGALRGSATA